MNNNEKRLFYDVEKLKSIPICDVAQAFGVPVKKNGNDYWCAIRSERTSSCKLYAKTNSFCDFGAANYGGDTIELTKFLNGCSSRYEAMEILAQTFGIQPEQQLENTRRLPSIRQFAKIGIYGDVATKNFDFHIDKYGLEVAKKISEKYHMTVEKLAGDYPDVYYQMLRSRAFPYVYSLRIDYFNELRHIYDLTRLFNYEPDISSSLFDEAREMMTDAETAERILSQAIQNPKKLSFRQNTYNLQADYTDVAQGKISVELTTFEPMKYHELKALSKAGGIKLTCSELPYDLYCSISGTIEDVTSYSAFAKGDTVTIVYDADFSEQINDIIDFNTGEHLARTMETTLQMFP